MGRLGRKHGLACDNLLSVEVVTAEGRVLKVSADENADLFWAVRGGGANLGVVTSFEFRLHPVGPVVYGGLVIHPIKDGKEVFRRFHDYCRTAPDELRAEAVLLTSPDGDRVMALSICCIGPLDQAKRIVQPLRSAPIRFLNEIAWKRTSAHSNPKRWAPVHDVILFYSRGDSYLWNPVMQVYEKEYLETKYKHEDARGAYRLSDLTGSGLRSGDSGKPWRGIAPAKIGRHWGVPRGVVEVLVGEDAASKMMTRDKLDVLDKHGYIYWTPKGKKVGRGSPSSSGI